MSNLVNIKITKRLVAIVCLLMLLIARRGDLLEKDVSALVKFLASANDPLPVGRVATLKNDVMNRSSAMRVPSVYTKLLHFVEMCISKTMHFVVITHFKNRAIFILGSCI